MPITRSRTDNTVSGVIAIATGLVIVLLVHMPPARGDAPVWVGDACAAAFAFAGLSIIANTRRWPVLVTRLAAVGAAYMLVVPAVWILIGGNPGRCSIEAAIGMGSLASEPAGTLCQSVFGLGALLTLVCALFFTWHAIWGERARALRRPTN